MLSYFPDEENAIRAFCDKIREICRQFPLYNLHAGRYTESEGAYTTDVQAYIESLTSNKKLQCVLAGTNILVRWRTQ
jgi:all-trans-retinol 13,14-reductase